MVTTAFLVCAGFCTSCLGVGAEVSEYEAKYHEWQASVDNLQLGKPLTVDYLAEHAAEHPEFLLANLYKTPYTTVILQKSSLGKKYVSRFKDPKVRTLGECRQVWIDVLEVIVYEKKYEQWKGSIKHWASRLIPMDCDFTALSYLIQRGDGHLEFLLSKLRGKDACLGIVVYMAVFEKRALEGVGRPLLIEIRDRQKEAREKRGESDARIGLHDRWVEILEEAIREEQPEAANDTDSAAVFAESEDRYFVSAEAIQCVPEDTTQPHYESKYLEWKQSIDNLDRKVQFGIGPLTKAYLAKHAEEHPEFLLTELYQMPFAASLLKNSPLAEKYESYFKNVRTLKAYRQAWIDVLEKIVYEKKFAAWHESVEKELAAGKSHVMGDRRLLSYLAQRGDRHLEFLLSKLRDDMFVTQILGSMLLFEERAMEGLDLSLWEPVQSQLKGVRSLQERQRIWIRTLKAITKGIQGILLQRTQRSQRFNKIFALRSWRPLR
ncbi:MAG: hypothetical protein PVH19_14470 [Planctomycetia bacterium]|jgi:hypothetical protein